MAGEIDAERLVVLLEARIRDFERNMAKASGTATRSFNEMQRRSRSATRQMEQDTIRASSRIDQAMAATSTQIGMLGRAFGGVVAARGAQQLVDSATRITNALKIAGLEGSGLNTVYAALYASAQKNAAPLEALVQLYGRAALVQKELKVETGELLKFTDNVALALRVSGKSAQESSGALLQLSQALGSGTVRAEEFNSMLEGALPIVQAAANGITEAGGSVAKLRQLVVDGEVSSEAFFRGFQAGAVMLEQQVATAQMTVAQGFVLLQNAAIDAAKRIDEVTGASASATASLKSLAEAVSTAASYADQAKGPYEAFRTALHGARTEAEGLWWWLDKVSKLNIPNNIARYVAQRIAEVDRTSPALPPVSLGDEMEGDNPVPLSRVPLPRSRPAPGVKRVSLSDYPVTGKEKEDGAAARSAFERQTEQLEKQIALLGVEASTIDQNATARARARAVVELETAARRANEEAGLKNTEVTAEQRDKINQLADAYANAQGRLEALNGPLASFARESANIGKNLETLAVQSLDRLGDEFGEVVTGAKSVEDAVRDMAASIIRDLAKIAIRQAVLGPIAGMFGGGMGAGLHTPGGFSAAFPVPIMHGGGVVGSGSFPTRAVPPSIFANAQRFHLGTDEVPAILQRGERVIPRGGSASSDGPVSVTYAPVYNVQGSGPEIAQLRADMARDKVEFSARVTAAVRDGRGRRTL